MARVTFKDPHARLHGTLCNLVYRVRNGKQFATQLPPPVLPKKATKAQRDKYKREFIVRQVVYEVQLEELRRRHADNSVEAMQQVADMYNTIKIACGRLYEQLIPHFENEHTWSKISNAIVYWYMFKKLPPELDFCWTSSEVSQDCIGTKSED